MVLVYTQPSSSPRWAQTSLYTAGKHPINFLRYKDMTPSTLQDSEGLTEIFFAHRNQKKAEAAAKEVSRAGGNKSNVQSYAADLSSLDQTKALAQQIQKDHPSVDVMLNNAGEASTYSAFPCSDFVCLEACQHNAADYVAALKARGMRITGEYKYV